MFHYMFKAESVALLSLEVPSGSEEKKRVFFLIVMQTPESLSHGVAAEPVSLPVVLVEPPAPAQVRAGQAGHVVQHVAAHVEVVGQLLQDRVLHGRDGNWQA